MFGAIPCSLSWGSQGRTISCGGPRAAPKAGADQPPGQRGGHRTGMLSWTACRCQRGGSDPGKSSPARPAKRVLAAGWSAVLRDRLATELEALPSADEAANWAHRSLPAKRPNSHARQDVGNPECHPRSF